MEEFDDTSSSDSSSQISEKQADPEHKTFLDDFKEFTPKDLGKIYSDNPDFQKQVDDWNRRFEMEENDILDQVLDINELQNVPLVDESWLSQHGLNLSKRLEEPNADLLDEIHVATTTMRNKPLDKSLIRALGILAQEMDYHEKYGPHILTEGLISDYFENKQE